MKFSRSTIEQLRHYVYALIDPRDNGGIFYVGKASATNRAFNHLSALSGENKKALKIQEIRASGTEPRIEILRYGLASEDEAFQVEAAVIDAMGVENLTNAVRGHGIECGRITAEEVERLYGGKPQRIENIKDCCIAFFIHNTYSPSLDDRELYDATRQFWKINKETRTPIGETGQLKYNLALAVVDSVVVRVFTIEGWFQSGSTFSGRQSRNPGEKWEFVGQLQRDHKLQGRRLTEGEQAFQANEVGFRYIN